MSKLRVEFESPESGAYIHEMTDKLEVSFCSHRVDIIETLTGVQILLVNPDGTVVNIANILPHPQDDDDGA